MIAIRELSICVRFSVIGALCALIIFSFSLISFAAPASVVSPMQMPIASDTQLANGDHQLNFSIVSQWDTQPSGSGLQLYYYRNGTHVYVFSVTVPAITYNTSNIEISLEVDRKICYIGFGRNITASSCNIKTDVFDVSTGALVYQNDFDRTPTANAVGYYELLLSAFSLWPNNGSSGFKGAYMITGNIPLKSSTSQDTPFVTWAAAPLQVSHYSSFIAEPVSDEYNRYIILAGPDGNDFIYWISFHLAQLEDHPYNTNTGSAYDIYLKNAFMPKFEVNSSSLNLSLYVDSSFLSLVNSITNTTIISYDIQITKFDLSDGTFLDMAYFSDVQVSQSEFTINYNFGEPSDYDSVCTYGCFYMNNSRILYNRLSCSWALDPEFLAWQTDMLDYSRLIYAALTGSGELVTLEIQTDVADQMDSARAGLSITDESGNNVDPVDAASAAFSDANAGMQNLASPVEFINDQMSSNVLDNPILLVPLIVGLALGLAITILGKNKSD